MDHQTPREVTNETAVKAGTTMRPKFKIGSIGLGLLLFIGPLASCVSSAPERSTANFCSTMKSEQTRILRQLDQTSSASDDENAKPFLNLVASGQAIGELQTYFKKLAKVAPEEIRTETEILGDKIDEVTTVSDLSITGIAKQLVSGISISGQLSTVNEFAKQNCGAPI